MDIEKLMESEETKRALSLFLTILSSGESKMHELIKESVKNEPRIRAYIWENKILADPPPMPLKGDHS